MKQRSNKKKMIRTTAAGLSLVMAPVLTASHILSVYAQPAVLTPDEQSAINTYLNTQPTNGTVQNLGKLDYTPAPSIYTFPGTGNYTTKFKTVANKVHFTQNYLLSLMDDRSESYTIKNWNTVEWYHMNPLNEDDQGNLSLHPWYWTEEVTFIKQSDNSEITLKNVAVEVDPYSTTIVGGSGRFFTDVFFPDFPIAVNDPRFIVTYEDCGEESYYINGEYWKFVVPMHDNIPYDTIVTIDESLKTGEVEEDVAGALGNKQADYTGRILNKDARANSGAVALDPTNYMQYTSDVIYDDIQADFLASDDSNRVEIMFDWGSAEVDVTSYTAPVARQLRVGIDYTKYVTEDGTELQPKVYGLQGVANFSGYEYVSTHSEPNGDRVHVYKLAPAPVTTPSSTATPKTGDTTNVFSYVAMMFTGLIAGVGAFFVKRKKFN